MRFSGSTGQHLSLGSDHAALNVTNPDTDFTLFCRIMRRVIVTTDDTVLSKYSGTGPLMRINGHRLGCFIVQNSGSAGREAIGTTPILPGREYSLAYLVGGGATTLRCATNGRIEAATTIVSGIFNSAAVWRVGLRTSGTNPFNGDIWDVALWNQELSPSELMALHEGKSPLEVRTASLLAYWPLTPQGGITSHPGGLYPFTNTGAVGWSPHGQSGIYVPNRGHDERINPGEFVAPPINTVAPVASGTPEVGQTLSCTTGTWNPTGSFTYQWQYNDGSWNNIAGATSSTWVVDVSGAVDVGDSIRCQVTATNAGGNDTADSNTLGPVTDIALDGHRAAVALG